MEFSNDLPDSTDWIPTSLPAFSPLEAALRCEVCKEFYNNPVITPCSHTFCSLCIRRCIAVDGKCPACKSACQTDKLAMNIVVREVVGRWADARPAALELARRDREEKAEGGTKRKREEAGFEEDEPARQTRPRSTRSGRSGRSAASQRANEDVVVLDSEDEDDEYVPDGFAKCPICHTSMKAVLVYDHVPNCSGERTRGRFAARNPAPFPNALQSRPKEPPPPAARLSGLNYAMLTETALRKKLKELGIPSSGSKALLVRRHQEWINIFNSNCDAADNVRKTKRELLRELDEWERTQGANVSAKDSQFMKKDFDGNGHAMAHKSQFDDLITQARAKAKQKAQTETDGDGTDTRDPQDTVPPQPQPQSQPQPKPQPQSQPYADNEAALSSIRRKVDEANETESVFPPLSQGTSDANLLAAQISQTPPEPTGLQNQFGSPTRKMPMFAVPTEPVVDVENSTTVQ
ncbi:DNA repair protein rad18 [Massarina eburnea CBS 473.64]|uniref:Postreplication repair E3 ubiquitin-protein ligase RAD18 n=1 Tax=Massarina eburnea CBS 473.64 TaxID=1395130 RepID=A0A6A6SDK5_9PLEO|nr:DNA repair protein rad18 [Massarina eburnea CBS 473.64]